MSTPGRHVREHRRVNPPFVIGVAVVLALGFGYWSFVTAERSISGRPTVDLLIVWAAANLVLYCMVRVWSHWPLWTQARVVACLLAIQCVAYGCLRVDGLTGNGRPILVWRWTRLPADRFREKDKTAERTTNSTAATTAAIDVSRQSFPQFRGTNRDGVVAVSLSDWSVNPPEEIWRIPVGAGWSSFAVSGNRCVTQEQRSDHECVVCYAIESGQELWVHRDLTKFQEFSGGDGPRATPTIDGENVYSLGATGILNCLDLVNGTKIWSTDILLDAAVKNRPFGMAGSPLVHKELVIVSPGGNSASLVAYDKTSGKKLWSGGDATASYSSPMLGAFYGVDCVLIFNGEGVDYHDLLTGSVLWRIPWISDTLERNNVCQPIVFFDQEAPCVFVSSGYGMGSAAFKIDRTFNGFQPQQFWQSKGLRSKFASAVCHGHYVFGLDEGIMVCLDLRTGKRLWKSGRVGHGQLLMANNFIVAQTEHGEVWQIEINDREFILRNRLRGLSQRTWNHPALTNNYLLIRNDREAVCYRLTAESE